MKTVYETAIGSDGLKAGAYIEGDVLEVKVQMPLAKILTPVNDIVDKAVDKLESLIPGDWDKALLDPVKAELKADILALLSE